MNTGIAILISIVFGVYAIAVPSFFIRAAWTALRKDKWMLGIAFSLVAGVLSPIALAIGIAGILLPWKQ